MTDVRKYKQPYTQTSAVGDMVQCKGFTPEHRLNAKTDEFDLVWEEHDLGTVASHEIAHQVTSDWRESLVGTYPID